MAQKAILPRDVTLLSDALDLPKAFGPYTLLRRIAVGGMAEVYVAKTKGIGGFEKLIAIKVIHPRFSEDEHFIQMLVEEAKISVQLNHVNIAQTFDLGCIDDVYYIAMEYIEGADCYRVGKRLQSKQTALPIDVCCFITAEVCNGVGYAHRKRDGEGRPLGIVHRDVSPQNVLISFAGEVKVVDFGIAKAAVRSAQTEVGVIKGKYYYMSPEQAWGDPVDQRSDIFSTGILLHELLTGEMVYQENNVPALLDRVRKAEIPSPREKRPEIDEALERVAMKAVAKEPSERYQSAHALGQDITDLLYKGMPTFTAARLALIMRSLYPEDAKRHSQILKLPPSESDVPVPGAPAPSEELSLSVMAPDEFVPPKEASVVFDLDEVDGEDRTQNDLQPFVRMLAQQRAGERATRQIGAPRGAPEPPTDQRAAMRDQWEDETFLKDRPVSEWDESTLVDDDGDAFLQVHRKIAAARREDPDPPEIEGEATIASENPLAFLKTAVAEPKGADIEAPAIGPKSFPRPGGVVPRSVPPPARMPPRAIPAPRAIPKAPAIPMDAREPPTLDEDLPGPRGEITAPSQAPAELPAERTVAFAEGTPAPPARRGPIAGPSRGGVRLGPDADRFFPQPPPAPPQPAQAPFDPFGGAPFPAGAASQPPLDDPFTARPGPDGSLAPQDAPLGTPRPIRWVLPSIGAALIVVVSAVAGAYLASRPDPTTLEVISVPEGASVRIDGVTLSARTPVTLEGRQTGQSVEVLLTHAGYEDRSDQFLLVEGENRRVYLLNPVRVTLHVDSQPTGAQIWINGVLRGSAPLDISGLEIGQGLTVRGTLRGRQTEQRLQVGEERRQSVTIDVSEPGR